MICLSSSCLAKRPRVQAQLVRDFKRRVADVVVAVGEPVPPPPVPLLAAHFQRALDVVLFRVALRRYFIIFFWQKPLSNAVSQSYDSAVVARVRALPKGVAKSI